MTHESVVHFAFSLFAHFTCGHRRIKSGARTLQQLPASRLAFCPCRLIKFAAENTTDTGGELSQGASAC